MSEWNMTVEPILSHATVEKIVKATGWAPIGVKPREGHYIPILMRDGKVFHVRLTAEGEFDAVVEPRPRFY